ncbi:Uncharacterised protein [Mycobacteroides abscessus subsp. abscessus]|nr:Uncharacterised protein [Mycobacteroides abscessus subsp. abscessus]
MAQEGRIRANDQHPVAFHPFALGVQQIRHPVQRHHRFARAGTALDHQYARMVESDDPVLFGLDGCHDVAHPVTTRRVHRGQQRGITQSSAFPVVVFAIRAAEDLIGEVVDVTSPCAELAPAPGVLGMRAGRDIKRLRRGRPPIDQQRFVVVALIEEADAPDVGALAGDGVQPAEAQPVIGDIQALRLPGQCAHLVVALRHRPTVLLVDRPAQGAAVSPLHTRAFGIEPLIQSSDVFALGLQFLFVRRQPKFPHFPCSPWHLTFELSDCAVSPGSCRKPPCAL